MSEKPIPQASPFVIECSPGVYAWCACGRSQKQPFCDGSHKGSEYSPVVEKITETKTLAWCGCKRTGNPPFCDGSHKKLSITKI